MFHPLTSLWGQAASAQFTDGKAEVQQTATLCPWKKSCDNGDAYCVSRKKEKGRRGGEKGEEGKSGVRKLRDCGLRWGRRQRSSQTFSWQEPDICLGPGCGDRRRDLQGTLSYRTCPPLNTWLWDSRVGAAGGAGLGSGEGSRNVLAFQGCGAWIRKAEKGSGRKPNLQDHGHLGMGRRTGDPAGGGGRSHPQLARLA